jgi:hypothetical protein
LKIVTAPIVLSHKNYGEITHRDNFLDEYKNVLSAKYKHPITDNKAAFAFILGVAAHRVSDDIWHNERDDEGDDAVKGKKVCGEINTPPNQRCEFQGEPPYADWDSPQNSQWPFKTCVESAGSPCYYGFIVKLRDLDALSYADAHTAADQGIDYLVYGDHRTDLDMLAQLDLLAKQKDSALDIAVEGIKNLDAKRVVCLNKKTNIREDCNPIRQTVDRTFGVPTKVDIVKDFVSYKWFAVDVIAKLANSKGSTGIVPIFRNRSDYKDTKTMEWSRVNYELDPDVGLNAIAVHVTKCISVLGNMLKDDAGLQKQFRWCEVRNKPPGT